MKVSETPTGFIAVPAFTGSDWDTVSFAIVRLNDQVFNEGLLARNEAVKALRDFEGFYSAEFRGYVERWCDDDNLAEDIGIDTDVDTGEIFYLDITEEEIKSIKKPTGRPSLGSIKIDAYDTVTFSATAKHSDDEYWTTEIPLSYFEPQSVST